MAIFLHLILQEDATRLRPCFAPPRTQHAPPPCGTCCSPTYCGQRGCWCPTAENLHSMRATLLPMIPRGAVHGASELCLTHPSWPTPESDEKFGVEPPLEV
eukprot:2845285-Rhodomonas_salina.2